MDPEHKDRNKHGSQPEESMETDTGCESYPEPESQDPKHGASFPGKPAASQTEKIDSTEAADECKEQSSVALPLDAGENVQSNSEAAGALAPDPTANHTVNIQSHISGAANFPEERGTAVDTEPKRPDSATNLVIGDASSPANGQCEEGAAWEAADSKRPLSGSRSGPASGSASGSSQASQLNARVSSVPSSCKSKQSMAPSQPAVEPPKITLTNDAIVKLLRMQNTVGMFSYYVAGGRTVVVHAEDVVARENLECLKAAVRDVVGPCCPDDASVNVSVKATSFRASFCRGNRIGANLMVGGRSQTIGMYVRQGGLVYYLSTAHNYEHRRTIDDDRAGSPAVCITARNESIQLPPPLACFAADQALGNGGRWLLHLIDIMVGLVPLLAPHVEAGLPAYTEALQTVRYRCRDCRSEECLDGAHGDSRCYDIANVYHMRTCFVGGQETANGEPHVTARYDATDLFGKILRCLPCSQLGTVAPAEARCCNSRDGALAGVVMSCDTRIVVHDDEQQYNGLNVLLIRPLSDDVVPRGGDSGSVWVLVHDSGEDQAVAITVGKGEAEDESGQTRPVWLAALLEPSLEAFWNLHAASFPSRGNFEPIRVPLLPQASASSPSTTASMLNLSVAPESGYATRPL